MTTAIHFKGGMGDEYAIYREKETGLVCVKQWFSETGDIMGLIKIRPENRKDVAEALLNLK